MMVTVLLFWSHFLVLNVAFALHWLSRYFEILVILSSLLLTILLVRKGILLYITDLYPFASWDGFCDHIRDVPWESKLNLVVSVGKAVIKTKAFFNLPKICVTYLLNDITFHIQRTWSSWRIDTLAVLPLLIVLWCLSPILDKMVVVPDKMIDQIQTKDSGLPKSSWLFYLSVVVQLFVVNRRGRINSFIYLNNSFPQVLGSWKLKIYPCNKLWGCY